MEKRQERRELRGEGLKRCSRCKEIKALTEYGKLKGHGDGLDYWCKACVKAYCQSAGGHARRMSAVKKYAQTDKGQAAHRRYSAKQRKERTT